MGKLKIALIRAIGFLKTKLFAFEKWQMRDLPVLKTQFFVYQIQFWVCVLCMGMIPLFGYLKSQKT